MHYLCVITTIINVRSGHREYTRLAGATCMRCARVCCIYYTYVYIYTCIYRRACTQYIAVVGWRTIYTGLLDREYLGAFFSHAACVFRTLRDDTRVTLRPGGSTSTAGSRLSSSSLNALINVCEAFT